VTLVKKELKHIEKWEPAQCFSPPYIKFLLFYSICSFLLVEPASEIKKESVVVFFISTLPRA
jgi:hypothetical protein